MKLVKINQERLNLYFTHKELLNKKINLDNLLNDNKAVNFYFNYIISVINKQTHSNYSGEDIFFQLIPLIDGDLLISMIKKEETQGKTSQFVYKFDDIEYIFSAVEKILGIFSGKSDIYKYENYYYLILKGNIVNEERISWILGEFGEKSSINKGILEEYGICVMKNNALYITQKHFLKGLKI